MNPQSSNYKRLLFEMNKENLVGKQSKGKLVFQKEVQLNPRYLNQKNFLIAYGPSLNKNVLGNDSVSLARGLKNRNTSKKSLVAF